VARSGHCGCLCQTCSDEALSSRTHIAACVCFRSLSGSDSIVLVKLNPSSPKSVPGMLLPTLAEPLQCFLDRILVPPQPLWTSHPHHNHSFHALVIVLSILPPRSFL